MPVKQRAKCPQRRPGTRKPKPEDMPADAKNLLDETVNYLSGLSTEFKPTANQIRWALVYLSDETCQKTALDIVREVGATVKVWYNWQRVPGFKDWLTGLQALQLSADMLPNVHRALYRRCLTGDPVAIKLFLQRFDPEYIERVSGTMSVQIEGHAPGSADAARERQRKQVESTCEPSALPPPCVEFTAALRQVARVADDAAQQAMPQYQPVDAAVCESHTAANSVFEGNNAVGETPQGEGVEGVGGCSFITLSHNLPPETPLDVAGPESDNGQDGVPV